MPADILLLQCMFERYMRCVCARILLVLATVTRPVRIFCGVWRKEIWRPRLKTIRKEHYATSVSRGAYSHFYRAAASYSRVWGEMKKRRKRLSRNKNRHFPPKTPVLITRYDEVSCRRKWYAAFTWWCSIRRIVGGRRGRRACRSRGTSQNWQVLKSVLWVLTVPQRLGTMKSLGSLSVKAIRKQQLLPLSPKTNVLVAGIGADNIGMQSGVLNGVI